MKTYNWNKCPRCGLLSPIEQFEEKKTCNSCDAMLAAIPDERSTRLPYNASDHWPDGWKDKVEAAKVRLNERSKEYATTAKAKK